MAVNRAVLADTANAVGLEEIAEKLDAAWATATPSPEETDRDAGRAIAIALGTLPPSQVAAQVDNLSLQRVDIGGADPLSLTPMEAFNHPLVGEWAGATFSDVIGDCLRSGRLGLSLSLTAPIYDCFQLMEVGRAVQGAVATLSFDTRAGRIKVQLNYGTLPDGTLGRTTILSGDALWQLGVGQRGTSALPPEQDDGESQPEDPAPCGPVLH